ncbi:CopG family transcriptional regulator [Intrasporangium sp.]|uniref:ribbon-helix-helix domain-containing protein n=1 Tax=Intrasporangium sp. TaxID=1925024 RepID=UPI003221A770
MQRTNLYLDERQTTALDQIARAEGVSRAEVVRRLIDRSLATEPSELDADLAAIESSFGALVDAPTVRRGPDRRAAHLDSIRRR